MPWAAIGLHGASTLKETDNPIPWKGTQSIWRAGRQLTPKTATGCLLHPAKRTPAPPDDAIRELGRITDTVKERMGTNWDPGQGEPGIWCVTCAPTARTCRSARNVLFCLSYEEIKVFAMVAIRKSVWVPGDRKLHLDIDLPDDVPEGEAEVTLVVYPRKPINGEKVVACLKDIAARGNLRAGPEPAEWQREIRKDRVLPGRE